MSPRSMVRFAMARATFCLLFGGLNVALALLLPDPRVVSSIYAVLGLVFVAVGSVTLSHALAAARPLKQLEELKKALAGLRDKVLDLAVASDSKLHDEIDRLERGEH